MIQKNAESNEEIKKKENQRKNVGGYNYEST